MSKFEDKHLQVYPNRPDLTIKSQAEHYIMSRHGRGPTHVEAYREGAKFLARLLKEGLITMEELDKL